MLAARCLPLLVLALTVPAIAQQPLATEEVATGLNTPVWVAAAPGDDASRIFVVTHWGRMRLVENDVLNPTPFLDVNHLVTWDGNEQGLLGMVFHPGYAQNGLFYITYVDVNGDWVLARYARDPSDPNLADPNSAVILLTIGHPFTWHHGGWMEFGQDGYLYVATGDGGGVGDPINAGQRGDTLLGKLLRLDVDGGFPYLIPPTNPFVNDPNVLDEIWALGVRNPWRGDMDDLTGDIWFGDVGQDTWEEVDYTPAGAAGVNYGWRVMEGTHCYNPPNCNAAGLTLPIHDYQHGGVPFRCSVTGGVVYRGRAMADLHGRFFFGDYCSGEVFSTLTDGAVTVDLRDHSADLALTMGSSRQIIGFGQDADGEIYVCDKVDGSVNRIVPAGFRLRVPHLAASSAATVTVSGGTPNRGAALLYSLAGLGSTTLPNYNVTLGIASPTVAAIATTDSLGAATFAGTVPAALQDRTLWFQAAQMGVESNIVIETVD
jgi:glucose/arabinose dehydrogenase